MGSSSTDRAMLESLGKYQIERVIGDGATGTVYQARDTLLGRTVALKILAPILTSDRAAVERFILEARSAAQLEHDNTVHVYEIDERGGVYYIAMELLEGGSAQSVLDQQGALPWPEATRWIADACRGLNAAHDAGMLHRDVKPANLFRARDGGVKLGDFGLVKLLRSPAPMITALGGALGTPSFMSPEQCQGEPLDGRTDVYSLGATYYALLTGRPPFVADTSFGAMFAHCSSPIPDPRAIVPEVPVACAEVIRQAMAKSPIDRYRDAGEMLAAIESIAAFPTNGTQPVVASPAPRSPSKRRRTAVAASVLAAIALLALIADRNLLWKENEIPSGTPQAQPTLAANNSASPIPTLPIAPAKKSTAPERRFESLVELGKHAKAVTDLEYSSSGKGVATASLSGEAIIWIVDVEGHKYRVFPGGEAPHPLHALAYHGGRRRLVSPWGHNSIALWDSGAGTRVDVVPHKHKNILALELSGDGKWLVSAGDVGVQRWELSADDKLVDRGPILADMPMVSAVAFSPVANWVGALSWSGEQFVWDYRREQFVGRWRYAPAQYTSLAMGKDRLEWTWSTGDGQIAPLSLVDRLPPMDWDLDVEWSPTCLDYAAGRRLIGVGGAEDGSVTFVNLESKEVSRIATDLNSKVTCLKFSPTDDRIALGTASGRVYVARLPADLLPPVVSAEEGQLDRTAFAASQIRASLAPLLRGRESKP